MTSHEMRGDETAATHTLTEAPLSSRMALICDPALPMTAPTAFCPSHSLSNGVGGACGSASRPVISLGEQRSSEQRADSRQQPAESREQTADGRRQTADSRQQTADSEWAAQRSRDGEPGTHAGMLDKQHRSRVMVRLGLGVGLGFGLGFRFGFGFGCG
jgi:hypothetical protein